MMIFHVNQKKTIKTENNFFSQSLLRNAAIFLSPKIKLFKMKWKYLRDSTYAN